MNSYQKIDFVLCAVLQVDLLDEFTTLDVDDTMKGKVSFPFTRSYIGAVCFGEIDKNGENSRIQRTADYKPKLKDTKYYVTETGKDYLREKLIPLMTYLFGSKEKD